MVTKRLTPILNVTDIEKSFAWFEKLGWKKQWDWGDPPRSAPSARASATSFCVREARAVGVTAA